MIETGGRTIHVGMPAKQAERFGVTVDPDRHRHRRGDVQGEDDAHGRSRPGRSGTIRDAADAIFWLCSPLSDYVTGQTITVSGGARGGMS